MISLGGLLFSWGDGKGVDLGERRAGGTGRSEGQGSQSQDVLYEKGINKNFKERKDFRSLHQTNWAL